jgi:hypothetical protein
VLQELPKDDQEAGDDEDRRGDEERDQHGLYAAIAV